MYKLLVVDDEPRQVRALVHIINQLRPNYEILSACDGQEAYNLISAHKTDILITDIKMPGMDGMQLIEKLADLGLSIKTIILSGYGEFEYAKKAIKFGVNEYLVKPVSKSDLESVLLKVESVLEDERNAKLQEEELKKKLDNSLPIYIDHLLNRWIAGKSSAEEVMEIESIFPYQTHGVVLVTSLIKAQDLYNTDYEFMQYARFSIKEMLNGIGHSISFLLASDKCRMVTVIVSNNTFLDRVNDLINKMNGYIKALKDKYGVITTIGIGNITNNIFGEIANAFQSAQTAVEHRFYCGLGKVILSASVNADLNAVPFDMGSVESGIMEAVRQKNKVMVSQITSDIFSNINKCGVNPKQFKDVISHILLNQANNVSKFIDSEDYNSLISEIKLNSYRCEECSELWHFTNVIICRIIDISNEKLNDKKGILINRCKKYIDENYMEDISLETVSQKFYFNPSYFSNLFKTHMGLGFSEYLLMVRIQNAKKLLKASVESMAAVANMVGFKDPTYFNRVFKKEVGISPLKYRQMNENG